MQKINMLLISLFTFSSITQAQLRKPVVTATNGFGENLSKIVSDFQNNYRRIQGEKLNSQDDMDTYRSSVSLPGAITAVILRFRSNVDPTASWQATMYRGDNYNEAIKIYKTTCRHVNGSRLMLCSPNAKFTGKTENPDPNVSFASSAFKLKNGNDVYVHYYAEVEIVNLNFDQWEVHLNLHNRNDVEEEDDKTE